MRIIAGTARSRTIEAPKGRDTRPTLDRVRENLFNILQRRIAGAVTLDLFGGSGQLGLEAVSRGAESCVIVDGDRSAQKAIEANIKNCGFEKRCQLVKGDSFQVLQRQRKNSYHLIFLDPPYGGELLNRALADICRIDILAEGGIIVCESAVADALEPVCAPYRVVKQYTYGHTMVTTVTREETV